jgi:predicted methyltransferase
MTNLSVKFAFVIGLAVLSSLALSGEGRLESDLRRDQTSKPEVVLALLDLQAGDRVADIFGGGGYYSELMGLIVGEGGVVLLHNNEAYLSFVDKALTERFENRSLPAVVRHDREVANMELGQEELDAAIIIMSYHDLYQVDEGWPAIDASDFLDQIFRALKPGGKFLIVDHVAKAGAGADAAKELHRITAEFARRDITGRGFEFAGESDALRNSEDDHSLMVFDPAIRGKTDRFVHLYTKPR